MTQKHPLWLRSFANFYAKKHGIDATQILSWNRKAEFVKARRKIIRLAFNAGHTRAEIARAFGFTWESIQHALKRYEQIEGNGK